METGKITQITCTNRDSYALLDDGTVRGWGRCCGSEVQKMSYLLRLGRRIISIAGGGGHLLLLLDDGTVRVRTVHGEHYGTDYDGTRENQNFLGEGRRISLIAAGGSYSLAVLDDGTVRGWGSNDFGQRENQNFLAEGRRVIQIACGNFHSLALLDDGTVRGWGRNNFGQRENQNFLAEGRRVIQIACGSDHSLALLDDGSVREWGKTEYPEFRHEIQVNYGRTPDFLAIGRRVTQIACGPTYSLALLDNDTVRGWGFKDFAERDSEYALTRRGIQFARFRIEGIVKIAAGGNHALALLDNGTVRGWGSMDNNQANSQDFRIPLGEVPVAPIIREYNGQIAGYKEKYLKYKQKYLQLKGLLE